jgi:hypothetical protein
VTFRATSYAAIFELDGDPADVLRAMNAAAESGGKGQVSGAH